MCEETEKTVETNLIREVEKQGGWCLKLWPVSISGLPDRMCLLPGAGIFFAELKAPGEKPRPIQRVVIARIRKLGFAVEVIDNSACIPGIVIQHLRHD